MAITRNEVQVQWSTANSISVSAGGNATSDTVTINATTIQGSISLKADNNGTAASGDTVDVYILYSNGDPDGASTDEFDSDAADNEPRWLARLDVSTAGKDPDVKTVFPSLAAKSYKIYAVSNAGTNGITVSATGTEVRSS